MRPAALLLAYAVLASPAPQSLEFFEYRQPHMGTTARLQLYATRAADADRIAGHAFARIRELNDRFSDYSETSELSRVSGAAGGGSVAVSDDLFRVIAAAQRMSVTTDGAFDITIGPVSHLWRRARAAGVQPDRARLAAAARLVGYRRLHVSTTPPGVRLEAEGMVLDLGGIAKGFAADAALEAMVRAGAERSIVAIGGDIVAAEPPPGKPGWDVVVETPGGSPKAPVRAIRLVRAAVSTSGDAEQFLDAGDRHYSHILNPLTGSAETGRLTVTVRAPDGATADALATAVKVLGPARGLRVVERFPDTAAVVTVDAGNSRRILPSRRWRDVPSDVANPHPPVR